MSKDMLDESLTRYFDTALKFNYFILSTTLAVLGLSIQIIKPEHSEIYPSFVFISWGLLLISFVVGIIWHTSWIFFHKNIHSALVKEHFEGEYPTINKSMLWCLGISWVLQILFLMLGIILIAVYKVINFYLVSPSLS